MMASNLAIPDQVLLFQPVRDTYGSRLALVFGNESAQGECPFYTAKQCYHCDIGAGEGKQFTLEMNKERLDFFREYYGEVLENIKHLVVYNSGSVLNRAEMSRETLGEIVEYAASLERCKIISVDSREMYVAEDALNHIVERLRDEQHARIIIGVESQNDEIRIKKLNKIMRKKNIERAFEIVGKYKGKIGLDVNIVFQPPELRGEEAITDAVETLRYGLNLAEKYKLSIDFNFHPYYPSQRSLVIYPNHPRANIEDSIEALRRMKAEIEAQKNNAKIFVGWQDEEHDQQQQVRGAELEEGMQKFDQFNVTQEVNFL